MVYGTIIECYDLSAGVSGASEGVYGTVGECYVLPGGIYGTIGRCL